MTKSNLGKERIYLASCTCISQSIIEGSQGRNLRQNLEAGIEEESMEECFLLICSPWFAQCAFSWSPGLQHLLRDCITHRGSGHFTSVISQNSTPWTCSQTSLMGGIFQIKIPSTRVCLGLCQVNQQPSKKQPAQGARLGCCKVHSTIP